MEGRFEDDGTPTAQVAYWNEFGTIRREEDIDGGGDILSIQTPARPFFRTMISEGSPTWGKKLGKILKAADYDVELALNRMGEVMQGQLLASIDAMVDPPNAPSTIKRKGFNKPLVDTGKMRKSVEEKGYEVKE